MNGGMIEVWRGSARQWEVDEMGHWNTQYYAARCNEALAILLGFHGLPGVFSPDAVTTIAFDEHHIRFHREARAGAPLHMDAGFLEVGDASALAVLVMRHSETGQLAATFRVRITHVDARDGTVALPWPLAFRASAGKDLVELPREAAPRSTGVDPVTLTASRNRAMELGLSRTALGLVERDVCDPFGRMGPHRFIGAVGGGVKQLTGPLHALVAEHAEIRPGKIGGALLEFRIVGGKTPRIGDCFEIWAGLQRADHRVMSLIFWMVDPFSGAVYGSMQSVAVVFDIDRRGIVEISPAAAEALAPRMIAGLAL